MVSATELSRMDQMFEPEERQLRNPPHHLLSAGCDDDNQINSSRTCSPHLHPSACMEGGKEAIFSRKHRWIGHYSRRRVD